MPDETSTHGNTVLTMGPQLPDMAIPHVSMSRQVVWGTHLHRIGGRKLEKDVIVLLQETILVCYRAKIISQVLRVDIIATTILASFAT